MFRRILNYLSRSEESLGPNEITTALYEMSADAQPTTGILGKPRMVDRGGQFSNYYRVVVPVTLDGDYDVADLEFDLPSGVEDTDAEFFQFLDCYGITEAENLGEVEGELIDIEWTNGTPVPVWRC